MKKFNFNLRKVVTVFILLSLFAQFNLAGSSNRANSREVNNISTTINKKILIVYFSHTGNTREFANQIHEFMGGDIVEIQTVKPYPRDYNTVVNQAQIELNNKYKPALKTKIRNIQSYQVIFVGYPNWWGTFPGPIRTFLSTYNLTGKIIIPFCTHLGSSFGNSLSDIENLCPGSTVIKGIAVWGKNVKSLKHRVIRWLETIKTKLKSINN